MTACVDPSPSDEPPLSQPTLAELSALELRYDGPIPPHALADLRAVTHAQIRTLSALNHVIDGKTPSPARNSSSNAAPSGAGR